MGAFLAGAGVAGSVASGFIQARAVREQGRAAEKAAQFNARVALREGDLERARLRRRARRELASQRVAFAKAGVRVEGSPLMVLMQSAAELEFDIAEAGIVAQREASLEFARAENVREQAEQAAGAALLSGFTRGATVGASLLLR